jgi:hypothetical protein
MKIIINTKKIERNRKIGSYTLLAGMVVLFGGLFISISQIVNGFKDPANPPADAEMMLNYATIAMFVGLLLTEVSMYFNNRWGRKPSIEEKVSLGLKGLDDRYTLYHLRGPVPTLLVGPAGIWVLVTLYQRGVVTFSRSRFQQAGVNWFTKIFYQEGIGRPEMLAKGQMDDVKQFIQKNVTEGSQLPEIRSALVFTASNVSVQVDEDEAPIPAMHIDKLKDFIRRKTKEQQVSPAVLKPLFEALPQED